MQMDFSHGHNFMLLPMDWNINDKVLSEKHIYFYFLQSNT